MLILNFDDEPSTMKAILLLTTVLSTFDSISGGGAVPYLATLSEPNVIFAVKEINSFFSKKGDYRHRTAVGIISATKQIATGDLFKFNIEIEGGDTIEACNVGVLSRSWLTSNDKIKLSGNIKCETEKPKATETEVATSLSDSDLQPAVVFLENSVNTRTNSKFYLKVSEAKKVTKLFANGVVYKLNDVNFVKSLCTQEEVQVNPGISCPFNSDSVVVRCTFELHKNSSAPEQLNIIDESCDSV